MVRFKGLEDHSFTVLRNSEDDRDRRVMVPVFRVNDDPELFAAVAGFQPTEGPGGIDAYMVTMGRWNERVTVSGNPK